VIYRLRQFVAALNAQISPAEQELVRQTLAPAEQALFAAMPVYDQRHCLDVYWTLVRGGQSDPLLLRAALFHDCGKLDDNGRPMPLVYYTLVTLLKYIPPLYAAAAASGRGPFQPVQIYAQHAWRGSRMAAAAGCPPEIVEIIRHYHDLAPTGRAAILHWADEMN
jgi:hypothetical protein